ncbi:MAG TPA: uroporphyrinogen decarboxylase family protein [Candidatus Latescibacteria bacterium]|jgi:uroporphyrinogen decarboxylase|nr:uroporphyrinogen decarboxylase family protein [Candidatus Latescibacterota bacterium]MDP7634905.1 uroporphyrinogen decarboxylase family protein [Candidatus Latescibacterota bacterium]HJN26937.1 uroporphyrinogen decarboxylase family protein [Candidatus Latescibacterota bacterium]|tara:strand:+ start:1671 stop:2798 length:1128 start_codon:yes stop_codon:yes gene_type:complete
MKPRDRVIAALQHREADRVPTGDNQVAPRLVEQILGRRTLASTGRDELEALWNGDRQLVVADYCNDHVELPLALDWDYVRVPVVPADIDHPRLETTGPFSWIDAQGYEVVMNADAGNIAVRSDFPKLTIDDLPDPEATFEVDPSQLDAIRHVVQRLGHSHFIVVRSPVDGTFPWDSTVGMDEFLVRMITDPEFVHRAVDAYVSRSIAYIDAVFDAGADAVMTTDDYSDNRGPIMGVERYREFVLPGLKRQCDAIHKRGGYFIKHTDGNTWPILDSFVEIGIDGWHGIQPDIGMDFKLLQQRYGDDLCFFGGVNCSTLIDGPAEKAREEVRYAIEHAAPGGGLVIATSNVVQPGTSMENYSAMRQAVRDFGSYEKT